VITLKGKEGVDLEVEYGAALTSWLTCSRPGEKSAVVKEFLALLDEGSRPVVLYLFNNLASPNVGQVPNVLTFTKVKVSFMRGEKH
jgi:hypothetical protein